MDQDEDIPISSWTNDPNEPTYASPSDSCRGGAKHKNIKKNEPKKSSKPKLSSQKKKS